MLIRIPGIFLACLCVAGYLKAQPVTQSNGDLQLIMQRLDRLEKQNDRLEKQNEELTAAIRQLSAQLGSAPASLPTTAGVDVSQNDQCFATCNYSAHTGGTCGRAGESNRGIGAIQSGNHATHSGNSDRDGAF